jgi:hypothetical protein
MVEAPRRFTPNFQIAFVTPSRNDFATDKKFLRRGSSFD